MKSALSDTLVICDMDNTLLTAKEGLPACNRTVINLFTSLGGLFTVATGRPPESIRAALEGIRLSLPAISCNGALLYDFSTETVLHRSTLNREQATTAIKDILNKFPRMGVEVMAGNGEMYVIHANETTHAHQVDEHLGSIACPIDCVPDGWVKVVFAADPEAIRKLGQYAKTKYYGRDNYFLATNNIYLEIMPGGVSKATGLQDLCALMNKSIKNTIVIGDYYNDLELMRTAGNIKEAADVLGILVELQEETGAITNGTAYYNAVCQRENFGGTTAIGDGIALPHACNAGVSAPSISALTLRHGVDWGAPDVRAVDLLFMIAVPPGNESLHLQILARLVNLLSRNSLVDALRHASSPERFVELIAKTENACFAD